MKAWAAAAQSNPSLNCTLDANITLPAVEEGGSNWTPVPNFTGTFDGNQKIITGLTCAGGLFGTIGSEGEVLDLLLEDVKITAGGYHAVGAIAGTNQGTVSGCSVEGGSVQDSGDNLNASTSQGTGGIVGNNAGGSVVDCSCSATINGTYYIGGIVGGMSGGNVVGCMSTGDVMGWNDVGGVVGIAKAGSIVCCGSTSNVIGSENQLGLFWMIGGVVGYLTAPCEVMYCCYSGQISGDDPIDVGGVVGFNKGGKVTACYWSGYDGAGIGDSESESEVEATKVDGVSVSWTDAVTAMNAALTDYDWEWSLDIADPDALPTPVKKENGAGE